MDTTSSQLLETSILSAAFRLLFFLDKVSNLKFKPNSGNFLNLNLLNLFWGLRLIICPRYLDDYWIPDLNSSPPTETLQTKLPFARSQLSSPTWVVSTVFRTIDFDHKSSIPLKTAELIHEYISGFNIINPGRNPKEFMYQKSWQPSFLTGSNSFWFALATASVQNGAMEPWSHGTSEERWEMSDPSISTEISPKLMEGSNSICFFLSSENDHYKK